MTRTQPNSDLPGTERRDFVKYSLFHLRPEWRRLASSDRATGVTQLVRLLENPPEDLALWTYSLVGTKAKVEMLVWMFCSVLEPIQELHAKILGTPLGGYIDVEHSYLGMERGSEYLGERTRVDREEASNHRRPSGLPYLFIYPFVKRRDWYGLPFEERRRIMGEHFRIGRRFPKIRIHTGYSFGLDDAEFILAFEAESPAEFLDLVEALRPSEASRYTQLETPIFTAIRVSPRRMVELAEGLP